jgi:hypothetical protein
MVTEASEEFREAFANNDSAEDRSDALESSDSYNGDGQGSDDNNNSNSDLDLVEGDDIGGDNSEEENEEAAQDFADEVTTGEIDGHAPDSEVNAVERPGGSGRL